MLYKAWRDNAVLCCEMIHFAQGDMSPRRRGWGVRVGVEGVFSFSGTSSKEQRKRVREREREIDRERTRHERVK